MDLDRALSSGGIVKHMSTRTREVGLAGLAFVLAAGLAFAQPGVKLSTVNQNGSVTSSTLTAGSTGGPGVKAPTPAADGSAKYWDGLGLGGASTNYFSQVPYIVQTPNPQIAVGPDDILTIVNRTISRYPNPNAAGNTGTLNPYNYPPTEFVPLDVWMGLTVLGTQAGGAALCPSGTGSNSSCVVDNASIRYDQLQGRYLVLFTVTDLPAHRSNWVLVVSTFAQFQKCPVPAPAGSVCPTSSPLFTPPVIAPIVGGTQTGGQNAANWTLYTIPINLLYNPLQQPNALGLVAPGGLLNSAVGTPNTVSSGGSSSLFLTTPFCPNGGPALPLTYGNGAANGTAGGTGRTCTNYYPTSARFGIDNDNIILTAPVLDMAYSANEGRFPSAGGQNQGPYAGTRVTTVAKIAVYNGSKLNLSQPGPGGCTSDTPIDCQAVNLSDNVATGTLSLVAQKIAFAQGANAGGPPKPSDLQYGVGGLANSCSPGIGVIAPTAVRSVQVPANIVLSCAPIAALPNALPAVFWEPDNLRGRALASFDAQVAPFSNTSVAGVITPIDYLVGTEITDNLGASLVPQGIPGVTGQAGAIMPVTAGIATVFYLQPIAFSCAGSAIYSGPSGVTFCGSGVPGGQSLVADLPFLGPLRRNASTLAQVADPSPVGQGFSATQMTTNPANTPSGTSTVNSRLFVGDSRPQQVIFREGLLYVARSVRLADLLINWLGTSTVLYDILKTCTSPAPSPACGAYSITGANIGTPAVGVETEWFNGQSVPDPNGNANGFGFYQPMFESPADVVSSGPVSPINLQPWFDKLFVGMTTGGTNNTLATFSNDFPSLWDFRPGDDAYDTAQPYLDPYSGNVISTYDCGADVTVTALGSSGATITVDNAAGLVAGMFLSGTQTTIVSIQGNVVTLSAAYTGTIFPVSVTFNRNQPTVAAVASLVTPGSNKITVADPTNLRIGQSLQPGSVTTLYFPFFTPITTFPILSATNVGLGETVTGAQTDSVAATLTAGSADIQVPEDAMVDRGVTVVGTGIPPNATVQNINDFGTFLVVTLSQNALISGTSAVKFDSTSCFSPNSFVTATQSNSGFVLNGVTAAPGVTINQPQLCQDFSGNLLPLTFTTTGFFPPNTSIVNISGSVVTLSNPAVSPLPGLPGGVTSSSLPFNFVTAGSPVTATCPLIPFSSRGGASTDPNDGSLWLYGEFAKNRLSTIPGPGQWGTSVANYGLTFPATDAYGNDNTYFQDVQPAGSPDSSFFTWIQLAKNLGLAVPSATGPCTINNGNTPILQPPVSGSTPNPSPSTLGCPYFGPDAVVTRARSEE